MTADDLPEVAELIYLSTNYWYVSSGKPPIFTGDPQNCRIFCETYEMLDPGCCLLAVEPRTGRIIGSCFYHPRSTHLSLGIVNVHPNHFGRGVARRLLDVVVRLSLESEKPLRLVSSAMNLDSFSLYTRCGFVPRTAFQDMFLAVPEGGMTQTAPPGLAQVRAATPADLPAIAALEYELVGIEREKDYRHFLENRQGIWSLSVYEEMGSLRGFLASVTHPASNMIGPGVSATEAVSATLLYAELDRQRGRSPVFLVPMQAAHLVRQCYAWGAKNCELHFAQVRGVWQEPRGIVHPTFLPETG
ncbi:MAG: GNAT family N-acetyltransferase [Capsulimonadales bacterium]|nr:GNAT family N-acetyltransferase [Capsulimonadales bacterium]